MVTSHCDDTRDPGIWVSTISHRQAKVDMVVHDWRKFCDRRLFAQCQCWINDTEYVYSPNIFLSQSAHDHTKMHNRYNETTQLFRFNQHISWLYTFQCLKSVFHWAIIVGSVSLRPVSSSGVFRGGGFRTWAPPEICQAQYFAHNRMTLIGRLPLQFQFVTINTRYSRNAISTSHAGTASSQLSCS